MSKFAGVTLLKISIWLPDELHRHACWELFQRLSWSEAANVVFGLLENLLYDSAWIWMQLGLLKNKRELDKSYMIQMRDLATPLVAGQGIKCPCPI